MHLQFKPFPYLTTERLLLRPLVLSDRNEIYITRTDPILNRFVNKPETKSMDDVDQYIEKISLGIEKNEWIYWVISIKENGKFAGTISLWNIEPEKEKAETGYALLSEFHGKGIMHEALKTVIDYGFNIIQLQLIEAFVHKDNTKSKNLLNRLGFKHLEDAVIRDERIMNLFLLKRQLNSPGL
jgi:ribosomal-protein-alanine N-acetyltransferase